MKKKCRKKICNFLLFNRQWGRKRNLSQKIPNKKHFYDDYYVNENFENEESKDQDEESEDEKPRRRKDKKEASSTNSPKE